MYTIDPSATVSSLAVQYPAAARTFDRFGIDFCCRGLLSLEDACVELGVSLHQVLSELQRELDQPPRRVPPSNDADGLIDHILEHHHSYAREELSRLVPLARRVELAHGERHRELREVRALLEALSEELLFHMLQEETIVFPSIRAAASGASGVLLSHLPIIKLQEEHEAVRRTLQQLRGLSSDFILPDDARPSYRVLYAGLAQFSIDLREQVDVEDTLIFSPLTRLSN